MMNKISPAGFSLAALIYFLGNAYILGAAAGAGRDEWLCVLIGTALSTPAVLLLAALSQRHPGQDLFAILRGSCPKAVCVLFSAFYAIYALALLSMSLDCFSLYVGTLILPETPRGWMAILLALCAGLYAYGGARAVCRFAGFLLPPVLIVIAAVFALSVPAARFSHLLPVGRNLSARGVYLSLAFPLAEPVLLTALAPAVPEGLKKRYWLIPYFAGSLILILNCARNTAVLGDTLCTIFRFPTAHTDSVVGYESIHLRLEALTTMIPAASGLVDTSLAACMLSGAAETLFGGKAKKAYIALGLAGGTLLAVYAFGRDAFRDWIAPLWPAVSLSAQLSAPGVCLLLSGKRAAAKGKKFLHSLKRAMK